MEPIGLCGGGLVALLLFFIAVVGVALLAGGLVLLLAKIGVTVDSRLRPGSRDKTDKHPQG